MAYVAREGSLELQSRVQKIEAGTDSRNLRNKLSIREIGNRTGLSRTTIKKWLRAPGDVEPMCERKPQDTELTASGLSSRNVQSDPSQFGDTPKGKKCQSSLSCLHKPCESTRVEQKVFS